jgi:diguanylate cyclase (GGDEF)-like protein
MYCQPSLFFIPSLVALLAIILLLTNKLRYFFCLSETDELTSLPNFRGFRRKLKKELDKHKKENRDFSIAILDIDGFSRFNNHSYALGDIVLQDFVKFLKEELPVDIFVARFRLGDEFILIFPYPAAEASDILKVIADKSKNIIHGKEAQQMEFSLSFSFGIASYESDEDTVETLFEKAEKALKENKKLHQ